MKVKRTERGWVGHFCDADRCQEDHDVNRLCYSGFTFFLHNLPIPVFDEEDDD